MKLTDSDRAVLRATPSHVETPRGPNFIGVVAWSVTKKHANCSAPYARPAGRVLKRLHELGLVERSGYFSWWRRTRAGDRVVVDADRR